MTKTCPFCAVSSHDDGTHMVRLRNEHFVVFNDRAPRHPTHMIIAPRVHAATLPELFLVDRHAALNLLPFAADVAQQFGLDGYKVVVTVGKHGGQRVMHTHAHLLSKSKR